MFTQNVSCATQILTRTFALRLSGILANSSTTTESTGHLLESTTELVVDKHGNGDGKVYESVGGVVSK